MGISVQPGSLTGRGLNLFRLPTRPHAACETAEPVAVQVMKNRSADWATTDKGTKKPSSQGWVLQAEHL